MPIEITTPGIYDSLREVAAARRVNPRTVKFWVDRGWIPGIPIPSAPGARSVVILIKREDWQSFVPPKPGARGKSEAVECMACGQLGDGEECPRCAGLKDAALEKDMERERRSMDGSRCQECQTETIYVAGVEYCPACGWREVSL